MFKIVTAITLALLMVAISGTSMNAFAQERPATPQDNLSLPLIPSLCPADCEAEAFQRTLVDDPFCVGTFDGICQHRFDQYLAQCLGDAEPGLCLPVGGALLPIESTSLLVAGAQTNMVWMLSALAVIGSVAFGALYLTSRKD